jgi:excisionase family DNA binding protein
MGLEIRSGGGPGNDRATDVGGRSTLGLMTPGEVAGLLHVDVNTVARWSEEGKFRHVRTPGGHRRYFASDILQYAMTRAR